MIRILLAVVLSLATLPSPAAAQIFDDDPGSAAVVPRRDPEAEALRSLVVPGWSQFRQGADGQGMVHVTVAFVSAVFLFGVADVPVFSNPNDNFGQVLAGVVYGANAVVSAFDAQRRAQDSNLENGWDLPETALRQPSGVRLSLVSLRF